MTFTEIIITVISWIVGFLSAVISARHLERKSVLRTIHGCILLVESRLCSAEDIASFHKWSVSFLEAPVFKAMTYLKREQQNQARNAWCSYSSFAATAYSANDPAGRFQEQFEGKPIQPSALQVEINKLKSAFDVFP